MAVSTEQILEKVVDLQALLRALEALDPEKRAEVALSIASQLIEFAAYEAATQQSPAHVAELIHIAAKLVQTDSGKQHSGEQSAHRGCAEI